MSPEAIERTRATRFHDGHLPANTRAVGDERVTKDGYVEVHVAQHRRAKANDQWRMKHHIAWEQANGEPVPPHTMIVFADHDRRNFDPGNLVAVPRGLWAAICHEGIPYHDRESLIVAMDIARLKGGVFEAQTRPRACRKCGQEFKPRYIRQRTCDRCLERK